MKAPKVGGLAFHLCIRFTREPGRVMFNDEVRKQYGVRASSMPGLLRAAVRDGWLIRNKTQDGEFYLCAGPTLEAMR
jgi:hypothetical protein